MCLVLLPKGRCGLASSILPPRSSQHTVHCEELHLTQELERPEGDNSDITALPLHLSDPPLGYLYVLDLSECLPLNCIVSLDFQKS